MLYTIRADGVEESIEAESLAEAKKRARAWVREGDFVQDELETAWVDVYIDNEDGDESCWKSQKTTTTCWAPTAQHVTAPPAFQQICRKCGNNLLVVN